MGDSGSSSPRTKIVDHGTRRGSFWRGRGGVSKCQSRRSRISFKSDDPKVVASGKSLYFTYCAQCHGKYHDGNGTVGQSFHPLPGDLQSDKVQSLPQGTHFKEISYGVPNGRQPALATTIELMDRWRIIAYVKSLGPRK